MKRIFSLLFLITSLCLLSHSVSSGFASYQKYSLSEYIDSFEPTAIKEMNRTGVPASITMAQAILESGYGNSDLAVYANNHFGLKCKPDWKGETYTMGSYCYKKYATALESYEDHSNHIKSRSRYAGLFKLKVTDYKGWSTGLKNAGYAQDPNYAYNLILLIERYNFSKLDSLYTAVVDTCK